MVFTCFGARAGYPDSSSCEGICSTFCTLFFFFVLCLGCCLLSVVDMKADEYGGVDSVFSAPMMNWRFCKKTHLRWVELPWKVHHGIFTVYFIYRKLGSFLGRCRSCCCCRRRPLLLVVAVLLHHFFELCQRQFPVLSKRHKNGFRIVKHRVIWSDSRFYAHVIFVHSGEDRIDLAAKIKYFLKEKAVLLLYCQLLTCAFVRFFDIFSISCFVMYPSLFLSMAWKARSALAEVLVSAGGEEEGGPGSFSPCSQAKMHF